MISLYVLYEISEKGGELYIIVMCWYESSLAYKYYKIDLAGMFRLFWQKRRETSRRDGNIIFSCMSQHSQNERDFIERGRYMALQMARRNLQKFSVEYYREIDREEIDRNHDDAILNREITLLL